MARDEREDEEEPWAKPIPLPPGGYDDPDYRPAIHGWRDEEHLRELLSEGKNSGPGVVVTPEYWENFKRELRKKAEHLRSATHPRSENPRGSPRSR